jgi:RNA polymerase sigma-70 factor (ECF subfamily)
MDSAGQDANQRSLHGQFLRVHHEWRDSVFKVLHRRMNDPHLAQDLLQETFLRYWNALCAGAQIEHPNRWLVRVAINLSEDWRRSFQFRHVTVGVGGCLLTSLTQRVIPPSEPLPVSSATLDPLWGHLKPRDQLVIVLRFFMGMDPQSIGDLLGIGHDAARMRLHRALRRAQTAYLKA